MFEELMCTICQRQFSNDGDLIPRLLPECGHTFCTKCLNEQLQQSTEGPFKCPEDGVECTRKPTAEDFPRNFALIRLAERTAERLKKEAEAVQEESKQISAEEEIAMLQRQIAEAEEAKQKEFEEVKVPPPDLEEQCEEHQRKLEIICIQDRMRICSTCALFGAHKGHDVRMEQEVVSELTIRTELLIQMYQIVDDISRDRVDQVKVSQMAAEFRQKSNELRNQLKEKFRELKTMLMIQEQKAETILKKNLAMIDGEIAKMQKVPARLFEDADNWAVEARKKLDLFEENMDKPNFINYDLLESKDPQGGPDIINFGDSLVTELEVHKDISMARVANQIQQLGLKFNQDTISKLKEIVNCERVDGVEIDEAELASLEDIMNEAQNNPQNQAAQQMSMSMPNRHDRPSDAQPITRQSLAALTGDENDLLSESPVFEKAKNQPASQMMAGDAIKSRSSNVPVVKEEPLDEQLVSEINDYLQGIKEDQNNLVEMSDSPIKSQGAECVAKMILFCDSVKEIRLSNCEIGDAGAIKLFEKLAASTSVELIDLSQNPMTERCFDSIETCLQQNGTIKQVILSDINVKSNFAWGKFKKFGSIVVH